MRGKTHHKWHWPRSCKKTNKKIRDLKFWTPDACFVHKRFKCYEMDYLMKINPSYQINKTTESYNYTDLYNKDDVITWQSSRSWNCYLTFVISLFDIWKWIKTSLTVASICSNCCHAHQFQLKQVHSPPLNINWYISIPSYFLLRTPTKIGYALQVERVI